MTTFTITRRAKQTYNQRITDHYEDTQTITLAELAESAHMKPEEWLAMSQEDQEQAVEEYFEADDWPLENCVKTEDEGWADDPDEHYEDSFSIEKQGAQG
jgi:hypothetical protein